MVSRLEKKLGEQKRVRKRRTGLLLGLFLLIFLAVAGAIGFWYTSPGSLSVKPKNTGEINSFASTRSKVNVLVLGIDERKNDIGRSNVTCVVTVDTKTKDVSMLWIPRDSRVDIPGHEWNKIGHAYAYDGHRLSEQTVSKLLGIPIDYYLVVNMAGFKKAIDAVGGVDINIDKRMYYYDPYDVGEVDNNGLIDLHPGPQHLNGETALEYVRFRHDEMGDIGRIERQQKFAKALLAQMATPSFLVKLPGVVGDVNEAITTDLSPSQLLGLGKMINDAYKQGLKTEMVPGKPVYIDGISYWLPDIQAMRKQVAEIQGINIDSKYLAATRSLAGEYASSIAKCKVEDAL